MNHQKDQYNQEASKSLHSMTSLLLPNVEVPIKDHETSNEIKSKLLLSNLSGIDSVCVVAYVQNVEDKAAKALRLAQHYRNLAERIRSENIKQQFAMEKKVELVRGFWRNQIKEGSSRAGRMVQRALMRHQLHHEHV